MTKKLTTFMICIAFVAGGGLAFAEEWAIEGEFAESCSCNPACPCMFGSPPTNSYCQGSRLVRVNSGHYGDVDLAGTTVMMVFSMGNWVKYHVDVPEEKVEAARDLMKAAFPGFAAWGEASTERADVKVDWKDDMVAFSVSDAVVEIEVMRGRDDKPIRVDNLTGAADYVQFRAVQNKHKHPEDGFEYKGTNGFTATVKAEGSTD